jgi:hypothetical protein
VIKKIVDIELNGLIINRLELLQKILVIKIQVKKKHIKEQKSS